MVSEVAVTLRAFIYAPVLRIARRKSPDASRSHELIVDDADDLRLDLVIHRRVIETDGEQLVWTHVHVLPVVVNVVGEISGLLIPEHCLIVFLNQIPHVAPARREGALLRPVLLLHVEGEAEGVVPEGVGLHLIAGSLCYRMAVDVGIHPRKRHPVHLRPEQAVRMHGNLFSLSWSVTVDYSLEKLSVFLPYPLLFSGEENVLLNRVGETQRSLYLSGPAEKPVLLLRDEIVENLLELGAVVSGIEGKAGERYDGLPQQAGLQP